MNTIKVLEEMRKDYDQDARNNILGCITGRVHIPEFEQKDKALTEAIEALKCDKVARVREEALKKLLAIKPINHAIYNMGHQDGLRSLILFIDQLDREQA